MREWCTARLRAKGLCFFINEYNELHLYQAFGDRTLIELSPRTACGAPGVPKAPDRNIAVT